MGDRLLLLSAGTVYKIQRVQIPFRQEKPLIYFDDLGDFDDIDD